MPHPTPCLSLHPPLLLGLVVADLLVLVHVGIDDLPVGEVGSGDRAVEPAVERPARLLGLVVILHVNDDVGVDLDQHVCSSSCSLCMTFSRLPSPVAIARCG